jgi:hypothetical protein
MSSYTKITKHRRLNKIVSVVDRWGPINSTEIVKKLSAVYGVPEKELKRNVQNDLKFLRDEGELVQNYYDKFGKFIGDEAVIDEDDQRFKTIKWQTIDNRLNLIPGLSELKKYHADLITLPESQDILSVKSGKKIVDFGLFAFYFELNHELYHLEINLSTFSNSPDSLFQLIIVRAGDYGSELIKSLQQEPLPSAILVLNDPYLSAITMKPLGPLSLSFHKSGIIHIADYGTKNPITHCNIEAHERDELLSRLTFHKNQTKTQHWSELKHGNEKKYQEGSASSIQLPCLIRVRNYTGFIVS